jgi:hypothetical protein
MCTHDEVYECRDTGDAVCRNCGQVIATCFVEAPDRVADVLADMAGGTVELDDGGLSAASAAAGRNGSAAGRPPSPVPTSEVLHAREVIMNICAGMHLDSACLVDTILCIYRDLLGDDNCAAAAATAANLGTKGNEELAAAANDDDGGGGVAGRGRAPSFLDMASGACRTRLAYAFVEALARQGTPRSPLEITTRLDVRPRDFLLMENKCCTPASYSPPSQYVERACAFLELPFYVSMLAKKLCERIEDDFFGYKPEGVVAACIAATLREIRNKEKMREMFGDLNADKIADVLGVSRGTVARCYNMLPIFKLRRRFPGTNDLLKDPCVAGGDAADNVGGKTMDEFVKKRCPYVLCDAYP